ncbi:Hypothetical protein SCLAV_5392 [Streptomyces clavuligerus]|uniref:Uncharacterized protein n=1 Tax=Streptomyces clavuligerus TaxID=1901 RepID=E2Q0B6_STRCL|nr:Hypothetical protein SCLAV_5392 [Streptomyces clavuligerus]
MIASRLKFLNPYSDGRVPRSGVGQAPMSPRGAVGIVGAGRGSPVVPVTRDRVARRGPVTGLVPGQEGDGGEADQGPYPARGPASSGRYPGGETGTVIPGQLPGLPANSQDFRTIPRTPT